MVNPAGSVRDADEQTPCTTSRTTRVVIWLASSPRPTTSVTVLRSRSGCCARVFSRVRAHDSDSGDPPWPNTITLVAFASLVCSPMNPPLTEIATSARGTTRPARTSAAAEAGSVRYSPPCARGDGDDDVEGEEGAAGA